MKRREFIAGLGTAAAWPLVARGQQLNGRMRSIAVLIGGHEDDPRRQAYTAALRKSLAQLGWIEGHNLKIDLRFDDGDTNRTHLLAAEQVKLGPEVIVVNSTPATRTMQQQTNCLRNDQ
jgi:putative tryptophan/tyrosine transport system substrate-binding protein